MPAVRYVALVALVVWLGGILQWARGDLLIHIDRVAFGCGAVILIALFVMKFVGPPPHAFVPRVALVSVMLALSAWGTLQGHSNESLAVIAAIGFGLLGWYARE